MGIKRYKPYTPSRRHMTVSTFEEITKKTTIMAMNTASMTHVTQPLPPVDASLLSANNALNINLLLLQVLLC